jgi:hypothetical protein
MITSLTNHDDHQVRIHLTRGNGPHYAALRCIECNKHIQWLSSHQTHSLAGLGVEIWRHYNTEGLNGKPYHNF